MVEVELDREDEGTPLHYSCCKIKDRIQREIIFKFTYWSDRCTRWIISLLFLIDSLYFFCRNSLVRHLFHSCFWVVLLWYAILFSLPHCGSCFFGMPSFLSFLTMGHASLACHLSFLFFRMERDYQSKILEHLR